MKVRRSVLEVATNSNESSPMFSELKNYILKILVYLK